MGNTEVTFTSTETKPDEIMLTVYFQITEYSEFEGIHKEHEVQLLSEKPYGDWTHKPGVIRTVF